MARIVAAKLAISKALATALGLVALALTSTIPSEAGARPAFQRIPTQFIAALAAPDASEGTGAEGWGLWRVDPGPRGVRLNDYEALKAADGVAPARWRFDNEDWWLEENGLIMEQPDIPLAPGRYLVTGGRTVSAILTVHPADADGAKRWALDRGATIHDVTHLRCRSARYVPATPGGSCTPAKAPQSAFPVSPGAAMPPVEGCSKQDYAVLFVVGIPAKNQ